MSRQFPLALFALTLGILFTVVATPKNTYAGTYYVAASGSDSNSGSETAPWAHLPGMKTWTGSHTPAAGDTFILRGCDVWGNGNFPVTWNWSGTSGNVITVGYDNTWYNTSNCPSAWNRAVFDAGNSAMGGTECSGSNINTFFQVNNTEYATFQWIEMKDYYWNGDAGSGCWDRTGLFIQTQQSDYVTFTNFYIHAWSHGSSATDSDHMIGPQISNQTAPQCEHCSFDHSILENADGSNGKGGPNDSGGGIQMPASFNVIHDVINALKPYVMGDYHDNYIYNVGANGPVLSGDHPNCIETIGAQGTNPAYHFYNNFIDGSNPGMSCEGFQVGNPGETTYAWNNVWNVGYNVNGGDNGPQLPQGGSPTVALYFFNNTIFWGSYQSHCVNVSTNGNKWSSAFVMENNHCITGVNPSGSSQSGNMVDNTITGAASIVFSNNIVESQATASGQGYTSAESYMFSPASSSGPTVGAGANLGSVSWWPAGFDTKDTAYACTQQTVSTVVQVVCPVRAANTRPTGSLAWDAGAYSFSSGSVAPNPPSGLAAIVVQ
jgi:hypothetical protein